VTDGLGVDWLGLAGIVLLVLGAVVAALVVILDENSALRRAWSRYEAALEKECRFLLYKTTGARIARVQLFVCVGLAVGAAFFEDIVLALPIPLVAIAPLLVLRTRHEKRVVMIETQLDSWLLILANALKATPSIGEAMASSAKIVRPPIQEELDLCLKELALGTPLDQAVMNMSARINSRPVSGALATILVGRQTGGDLTRILEESAATLREMARLEGVVRTKTAEGRSQAYVLGGIPFVLIAAIYMVDPNWLKPLTETNLGYAVIGVSVALWLTAIVLARRILAVDI
jgi:tight adherence protein B